MHKRINIICKVLFVFSGSVLFNSQNLYAFDFVKNFSLPATVKYDDNVTLSSEDSRGAFRYTLTPNLSLSREGEVDDISIRGSLNILRSNVSENLILDREDPSFNANWSHRFSRGTFSLGGSYSRSSTRTSEFDQTGLVFRDGNSTNRNIISGLTYDISDRISSTVNLGYTKQTYDASGLSDFESYDTSLQVNYQYVENLSFYSTVGYSKFLSQDNGAVLTFNQNGDQNTKRVSVGANYAYSPVINLGFSGGYNEVSTGNSGWTATANFDYDPTETTNLNLAYSRGNSASGLGGFQESDNLNILMTKNISLIDTVGFNFGWNENRSLNSVTSRNFSAFYNHILSQNWSANVSYDYRSINSGAGSSAAGAGLGVTLSYNLPNF